MPFRYLLVKPFLNVSTFAKGWVKDVRESVSTRLGWSKGLFVNRAEIYIPTHWPKPRKIYRMSFNADTKYNKTRWHTLMRLHWLSEDNICWKFLVAMEETKIQSWTCFLYSYVGAGLGKISYRYSSKVLIKPAWSKPAFISYLLEYLEYLCLNKTSLDQRALWACVMWPMFGAANPPQWLLFSCHFP